MIKALAIAGATVGIAAAGLLVTAGSASADSPSGVITKPTTSYSSPSNKTVPVQSLPQGTLVDVACFTEGQVLDGNHYWFRLTGDEGHGYVHRSAISVAPDVRHC